MQVWFQNKRARQEKDGDGSKARPSKEQALLGPKAAKDAGAPLGSQQSQDPPSEPEPESEGPPAPRWVPREDDLELLRHVLAIESRPGRELCHQLAERLHVQLRQVHDWFKSERQRLRTREAVDKLVNSIVQQVQEEEAASATQPPPDRLPDRPPDRRLTARLAAA